MPKAVLIVGPRGCGKSLHGEALRQHFGCEHLHDNWQPSHGILPGTLMLTSRQPGGTLPYESDEFDAYTFEHAMRLMNDAHDVLVEAWN